MHGNLYRHSTKISRILALDLGKFNRVLCVYDPVTHEHREHDAAMRRAVVWVNEAAAPAHTQRTDLEKSAECTAEFREPSRKGQTM